MPAKLCWLPPQRRKPLQPSHVTFSSPPPSRLLLLALSVEAVACIHYTLSVWRQKHLLEKSLLSSNVWIEKNPSEKNPCSMTLFAFEGEGGQGENHPILRGLSAFPLTQLWLFYVDRFFTLSINKYTCWPYYVPCNL